MEVSIPAFIPSAVITAPAYTDRIECIMTVASCRLVTAEAMVAQQLQFLFRTMMCLWKHRTYRCLYLWSRVVLLSR